MNNRKLIAVIFFKITHSHHELIKGITAQANSCNCDIAIFSIFSADDQENGEKCIFDLINFEKTDGIIFIDSSFWVDKVRDYTAELIKEKCQKPVIVLNSLLTEKYNFYNLKISDKQYIHEITSHLIEKHHFSKIYFLTGPKGNFLAEERIKGYLLAMRSYNLNVKSEYIRYGNFWTESGELLANDIASGKIEKPEAVVCANDIMAIALANKLESLGFAVPDDIAVTGFDASSESILNTPSITTYLPPDRLYGSLLVCKLLNLIEKKELHSPKLHNGKMIINTSCGCRTFDNEFMKTVKNQIVFNDKCREKIDAGNMPEKLLFADNLEKFIFGVDELTYLINGYDRYFLCLNSDFIIDHHSPQSSYSDEMIVMLDKIEFVKVSRNILFQKTDMLPALSEASAKPRVFYFTPLYFNSKCYGFSAVTFKDNEMVIDYAYRTWNRNISNALHFLSTKDTSEKLDITRHIQKSMVSVAPKWLYIVLRDMSRPENFILGLPRMLDISHVSQEHLIRVFKKYLGTTPTHYINDLRLEYAVSLIEEKNYEITDACFSSGFNNISHFYHTFKKKYGCSPKKFITQKNAEG
ncbi:MAG: substrate-binding domain-containing protein [Oscillospiraceae bacterium]|nr:substrate-binding domain-containing protein [Oscillospiraceae bacterium]